MTTTKKLNHDLGIAFYVHFPNDFSWLARKWSYRKPLPQNKQQPVAYVINPVVSVIASVMTDTAATLASFKGYRSIELCIDEFIGICNILPRICTRSIQCGSHIHYVGRGAKNR